MRNVLTAAIMLIGLGMIPTGAAAQSGIEGRVDRLEGEMRAVQRKVFPGGSGQQLIQPDISSDRATSGPVGSPSGSPVADLTARVDALESQLSGLTGQIEQNQFKLRQIEEGFAAFKRSTDARLKALEDGASSTGSTPADLPIATVTPRPVTPKPAVVKPVSPPPVAGSGPIIRDPARVKLVAEVEKPATGDAPEDSYTYGFRLREKGLYPEAETQLRSFLKSYPTHRRASRASNLLGLTLLDQKKPNLAVLAFYDNYRTRPDGDRAPDSLLNLAQTLVKLKKPASEVCKVYGELTDVYGAKMSETMKADVARGRAASKCQ